MLNLSFGGNTAPDRNSGLIGYYELIKLLPDANVQLVLIDKNFDKDVEPMTEEIKQLIYPKTSHMDFNIATALKLATKQEGRTLKKEKFLNFMEEYFKKLNNLENNKNFENNYNNNMLSKKLENIDYENFIKFDTYICNSKIILSGLGADEFFGGYSRYRTKAGLIEDEMSKDIDRIWIRNFGRDDRSCSDNGIELRYPFFDYELLYFLKDIKDIKQVTDFDKGRGIGEKILLRKVCSLVGFNISCKFEKRAIQFGTKLAKETNIKKYGSNRKANGKAQFK